MRKLLIPVLAGTFYIAPVSAGYYAEADLAGFEWVENSQNGSQLLKETGTLPSLKIGYMNNKRSNINLGYSVTYQGGSVDYDGQTQGGTPVKTQVDYSKFVVDGHLRTGSTYLNSPVSRGFNLLGIRYSNWTRDLQSTSTATGYAEKWDMTSAYWKLGFSPKNSSGFFGSAELEIPLTTTNKVDSSVFGGNGTLSVKPKGNPGLEAELGYSFGDYLSLSGYYKTMTFKRSDPTSLGGGLGSISQPESELSSLGFRVKSIF